VKSQCLYSPATSRTVTNIRIHLQCKM